MPDLADHDLFLFTSRSEKPQIWPQPKTNRTNTAAGLRVLFAFLWAAHHCNAPHTENWRPRLEWHSATIGQSSRILKQENYCNIWNDPPKRRLLDAKALLQEWVTFYPQHSDQNSNPRRFRAQNREWAQQTDLTRFDAYWGGRDGCGSPHPLSET